MPVPSVKQQFIHQAKTIFTKNTVTGYSKRLKTDYKYISPAYTEYVFQWLWDTGFHAIILSHFDNNWAKNEIKNLLLAQDKDGFIPHIIFWKQPLLLPHWAYIESKPSVRPFHSAITQPPVISLAAEKIYERDHDKSFLEEVLPKLVKFHDWLLTNRDPDGNKLVSIISPNESGMDELPVFQIALGFKAQDTARLHYYYRKADLLNQRYRFNNKKILEKNYFNVEEVLFNTINIEAMRSVSRLLREIGARDEALRFRGLAAQAEQALLKSCWDEEDSIFYSLYSQHQYQAKVKTIASLMPIFLEGIDRKRLDLLVKGHLLNPEEFWLPYPVPSVSKDEPYFFPQDTPKYKVKLLWRGPTWVNTNWFIVWGLRKHGYDDVADEITRRTVAMIQKWGFREYYNPLTGEGYRRRDFGWSTLVVDML